MRLPDHFPWETCMQVKKQQKWTWNNGVVPNWKRSMSRLCMLSPCLFNLYAEYILWNAGLDEAQAGIKTAGRNINNLRYADDTTLIAESEEVLKCLMMKVKEESEKADLKLNIQKTKIMAFSPITSWQNRRGRNGNSDSLFFWALKSPRSVIATMKLINVCSLEGKLWQT